MPKSVTKKNKPLTKKEMTEKHKLIMKGFKNVLKRHGMSDAEIHEFSFRPITPKFDFCDTLVCIPPKNKVTVLDSHGNVINCFCKP